MFRSIHFWIHIILFLVFCKIGYQFLSVLQFNLHIPLHDDAPMYYAAGRGLLQGLPLYEELFESKPPGIYLLTALSLYLTDGPWFANVVQVIFLLCFPVVIVLSLWKNRPPSFIGGRYIYVLTAAIFAILCSLFVEYSSGRPFATETFAGLFALLYVVVLTWDRDTVSVPRILLCSLFYFLAILFKEPFGIVIFVCAILLSSNKKFFIRGFVIPTGLSVLGLVSVLVALGGFDAYLQIYLPEMFTHRLASRLPFWYRVSTLSEIIRYYFQTPLWMLAVIYTFLWSALPVCIHSQQKVKTVLIAAWCLLGLGMLTYFYQWMNHLIYVNSLIPPFSDPIFLVLMVVCLVISITLLCAIVFLRKNVPIVKTLCIAIIATYSLAVSLAMGGYMTHQHVQSIPVLITLFMVVMCVPTNKSFLLKYVHIIIVTAIVIAGISIPMNYVTEAKNMHTLFLKNTKGADEAAAQLDAVMDSCNIDRYISFGSRHFWGRTEHSPLVIYYEQSRAYGDKMMPHMRKQFFEHLAMKPLLIARSKQAFQQRNDIDLQQYVADHYTSILPECAQGYTVEEWELYFAL